jgi:enoyl-CoA hydratase/carnithine racemase
MLARPHALAAVLARPGALVMRLDARSVGGRRGNAEAAEGAATEGEAGDESFDRHGDLLSRSNHRQCSERAITKLANRLACRVSHMRPRPAALRISQANRLPSRRLHYAAHMSGTDAVRYHIDGAVGVITLNRPDNRNSMTPELLTAFEAAVAATRADTTARCVVVTGSGSCFSSGADFRSGIQASASAPHERTYAMYAPFLSLLDVDVPIIAACNGHTVGGGFGLALVCDLRVGALEAKYGANFVKLGLAPGMAISYLLPRVIGLPRANELLLTGRLVDGREAEALGILNRAVPAGDVLDAAMTMARTIADNAPIAVRATKAAIRRGLALHVREAANAEAYAQAETLMTEDAREGIAALLAKRVPSFSGR